jgi:hypothetical protein
VDSPYVAAAVKRHPDAAVSSCDLHAQTIVFDRLIPDEERHHAGVVGRALSALATTAWFMDTGTPRTAASRSRSRIRRRRCTMRFMFPLPSTAACC